MKLQTLTEEQILITFISLSLLLMFSYVFGTLIEKIKGPRVVGEIFGGMVLGGSGLFLLFPNYKYLISLNRLLLQKIIQKLFLILNILVLFFVYNICISHLIIYS